MDFIKIILLSPVICSLLLWLSLKFIRVQLRQPPNGFMKDVVTSKLTRSPLPKEAQTPAVRRQLILASEKPAALSNFLQMDSKTLITDKSHIKKRTIYGFLHPKAEGGGGGERVLWAAVKEVLKLNDGNVAAIYVSATPQMTALCTPQNGALQPAILEEVKQHFGIGFSQDEADRIVFIGLTLTLLVDPITYPALTLLGQAVGMAVLGYEAISNLMPDVFVDTTGLAFSYPIVSFFARVPILAYVHYPFIQSEMISTATKSGGIKGIAKQQYYRLLAALYKFAGRFCTVISCNSTWTKNHLIWGGDKTIVYPPCAVQDFPNPAKSVTPAPSTETGNTTPAAKRSPYIVYLAQFRPEKRHDLVIMNFANFLKKHKDLKPRLILIGSARNQEDAVYILQLNTLAEKLGMQNKRDYEMLCNMPWVEVRKILESSSIGLNAMWNEHFGMSVVEVMAAGLIPVVHASAGPLLDIVKDVDSNKKPPGFFFRDQSDPDAELVDAKNALTAEGAVIYPQMSDALAAAFELTPTQQQETRQRAYLSAMRFSDEAFAEKWNQQLRMVTALIPQHVESRRKLRLFD